MPAALLADRLTYSCRGRSLAGPVEYHRAGRLLGLRIKISNRDAELGPGREHAHACDFQGKVLMVRSIDYAIENRVIESFPPGAIFGGLSFDPSILNFQPVRRHGHFRSNVIWPNLGAPRQQQDEGQKPV